MDEFEYMLYLEPTKQKLYFETEKEAIRTRDIAINAQMYCWLIYIKK